MGLLMLYAAFADKLEKYLDAGIIPLAILLFSGLILMGYCLFHDAFWGLSSKKNKTIGVTVWAMFSVLNVLNTVENISPDKMWVAGRLSSRFYGSSPSQYLFCHCPDSHAHEESNEE